MRDTLRPAVPPDPLAEEEFTTPPVLKTRRRAYITPDEVRKNRKKRLSSDQNGKPEGRTPPEPAKMFTPTLYFLRSQDIDLLALMKSSFTLME